MAAIRIYLLLIGLPLLLTINTVAQKSPLVITGTIVEVRPGAGSYVFKNNRFESQDIYFDVQVSLQYHNLGEVPLIVPTPNLFNGNKKLLFFDIASSDSKVSASVDEWMTHKATNVLTELGRIEPSRLYFVIIEPGGYYETVDTIRAKSGYKLDVRPSEDKRKRDLEYAMPEHAYFKVRYSLSMNDSLPVADAKRRWGSFGKLLTNADGDFLLESDVIINKLPD